jgi:hypothetical protein
MTDTLGIPPNHILLKGTRRSIFFDQQNKVREEIANLSSTI